MHFEANFIAGESEDRQFTVYKNETRAIVYDADNANKENALSSSGVKFPSQGDQFSGLGDI